jgi:maltose-binding protein MalE
LRVHHIWILLVILAFLLSACQQSEATASMTALPVEQAPEMLSMEASPTVKPTSVFHGTVRIWLDWDVRELNGLRQLIASFTERYPEVTFAVSYYPEMELLSAFRTADEQAGAPSILFAPSDWGPALWQDNLVLDLTSRVDAELETTVHPLAWGEAIYQGAVIGLPIEMKGVVLFRNRALVNEAAATVSAWLEMAQQLKNGQIIGAGLDYGFMFSVSQLAACGGWLFDEEGVLAIDSPAALCWLNLMRTLRVTGRVTFNTDDDLELFETGQSAWLIEGTWNIERLTQAIGADDLAVDPWPLYRPTGRRLSGFVWTENAYLMPASSPADLEASWAFMRYLLTPEAQLILSEPHNGGRLPALAALELDDPLQAQMAAALSLGSPWPLRTDLDLFIEPIEGAIRSTTTQGAEPEFAIELALLKIDQLLTGETENE